MSEEINDDYKKLLYEFDCQFVQPELVSREFICLLHELTGYAAGAA